MALTFKRLDIRGLSPESANEKLAKSLKEMNKIPESCKTLTLIEENYNSSKFSKDPEKIKNSLNCVENN